MIIKIQFEHDNDQNNIVMMLIDDEGDYQGCHDLKVDLFLDLVRGSRRTFGDSQMVQGNLDIDHKICRFIQCNCISLRSVPIN